MNQANQNVFSIESMIGRAFMEKKDGKEIILMGLALGEKTGKLRGEDVQYLMLTDPDGNSKVISPTLVDQLQDGKEHKNYRLLTVEEQQALVEAAKVETTEVAGNVPQGLVLQNAVIGDPAKGEGAVATEGAAPAPFVAVTKKSEALRIYNEDRVANLARKDTIAKFKSQLSMSDQGASTYYQNFKSGKWTA